MIFWLLTIYHWFSKIFKNLFCTKRKKSRCGVCVHMIFLRIFVAKCRFLLFFQKFSSRGTEAWKITIFEFSESMLLTIWPMHLLGHFICSMFNDLYIQKIDLSIFQQKCFARNVWNWGSGVCVYTIFLRIFVAKCRFPLIF